MAHQEMNHTIFADLHIHIGSTGSGRPVKITASRQMTIKSILDEAAERKGLQMIGVIDCHVPEVLDELTRLVEAGVADELTGGGIRYQGTTLIMGTEIELYDETCHGPVHVLCYLPDLKTMKRFSEWMSSYQKNISLSSQRSYVKVQQLQLEVSALGGLFIPAHIFTPFKGVYGAGVNLLMSEIFDLKLIDGVELGLSSDSALADQLPELHQFTYLSNSDAHSLPKIGREYQRLQLPEADFFHLQLAVRGKNQAIVANYGLSPKLGKYYQEVSKRINYLAVGQQAESKLLNHERNGEADKLIKRPPYIHQIPLEFIPGLGPKRLNHLIDQFGSEMNVLHHVTQEELEKVLPHRIAEFIVRSRTDDTKIVAGGAGRYGRLSY